MEQYFDQLLRYFARPIPSLQSLDHYERQDAIRKMHAQKSHNSLGELMAHCSSLSELRFLVSLEKQYFAKRFSKHTKG